MSIYAKALEAYFSHPDALKQAALAAKAKCTQAAISRYAKGSRFPDADTAQRIAEATEGMVPFNTWRQVAAERAGLAA